MTGEDGRVICSAIPLLAVTVRELPDCAVTIPTKSSIKSSAPLGALVRGSVAAVTTFTAVKSRANVPELTVIALFKFKFNEIPDAWPDVSVRGNGAEITCDDPAVKTILQMVPVRHVPFRVVPD